MFKNSSGTFHLQLLLLVAEILIPGFVSAVEVNAEASFDAQWTINADDLNNQSVQLAIKPEASVDFNEGGRLTVIGRVFAEGVKGLRPGDINRDGYSAVSEPFLINDTVELEIREFYFETAVENDYLIVGKQQVVWGKADGLKVLDVVNPQSFREFILEDFEDSRIPLWMFNYEWQANDNSTLQFLWIPDQTMHALPKRGATYSFTSPRLVPVAPPGVAVEISSTNRPSQIIADSDIGLRWSTFVNGWDFTLNYLYHYDDFPVFYQRFSNTSSGPTVVISPSYERSHLLGGTFSNAFGNMTVRGEVAYSTDRFFITRNPVAISGVVESDEFSYVIGLDWFGFNETLLSFQFFQSIVVDSPKGLTRPIIDNTVTFLVQKKFLNDTLNTEILMTQNMKDNDGLIRPKMSYEWNDDVKIWGGADMFYGDRQGLFGQYDDNDRFVLGVEVHM